MTGKSHVTTTVRPLVLKPDSVPAFHLKCESAVKREHSNQPIRLDVSGRQSNLEAMMLLSAACGCFEFDQIWDIAAALLDLLE